jgi:hypothetical protein
MAGVSPRPSRLVMQGSKPGMTVGKLMRDKRQRE